MRMGTVVEFRDYEFTQGEKEGEGFQPEVNWSTTSECEPTSTGAEIITVVSNIRLVDRPEDSLMSLVEDRLVKMGPERAEAVVKAILAAPVTDRRTDGRGSRER